MQEPFLIKKVAVLGAGVMGAQIAAHCVNAGIETLLFDLAAKEGKSNALVDKAIANLNKLKPSPVATSDTASLIQAKNYSDDLNELTTCDLIIEAIAERMDWKEDLYKKITPVISSHAILVSNTSGLSINKLCSVLPETLHHRFCGVHFFNPPRYMHLAELIPAKTTSITLLESLEAWLTSYLGKGVVIAKDTPNFIANRIGVFSLLATLEHAQAMQLGLDEVDALTGALIGRPKSATFRTMDVVGLDTMQHVVNTMNEHLTDDPWHGLFKLPEWLIQLISEGHLGQKTGQGIYRKTGKTIEVFDYLSGSYRLAAGEVNPEIKAIMGIKEPAARMQALLASQDKQAQFLTACYRDLFHYCAYHLEHIATSVRDIDLAMRWGFGWNTGPFETWQYVGLERMRSLIEADLAKHKTLSSASLPAWVNERTSFYTEEGAFAPATHSLVPRSSLPVYKRQYFSYQLPGEKNIKLETLFENEGLRLCRFKDDVGLVSFKSKANTIGQSVLDGLHQAIDRAERQCRALIIYQDNADNFSSGADLRHVASLVQTGKITAVEEMIEHFQQAAMRLKYCAIPTIAALRGRALGGGCELMMHCHRTIAAFESYPGLVEVGVGLIPAGGGCKEMALRAAESAGKVDLMTFIQPFFEQIATGTVASSAADALQRGFLKPTDHWVMHREEVLYAALAEVEALVAQNYQAPLQRRFKVAGREGHAKLQAGLVNWLEGGFISEHDYYLANLLAEVLCGGNLYQGEVVDEQWLLKLERDAFIKLLETPLTQARIAHLLETGKPLRN
ncbi:3-hydroxyacyl-CoA dehydrogenase [Legionella beliardensis]|uniref:3-hydroxyacyl-CoA dehydrogenase n=1 Tax=Legionella beliardensis TaxID=91822 RepID=A0A378I9G4_9GAMM|nr:3-hydroxyacyl-CoA dehydrogenase/enoyl-CoA hydratase family protein [Legionella beliardensis]STX29024.1 3-hydroxyacyl-CoA dehydrogenase [Legionella beliardensis]